MNTGSPVGGCQSRFVRKAPACTVQDLATAMANVFGVEPQTVVIGTRHSEKLYETLLSREEVAHAEDKGEYFRVPLDSRSLDYGFFFDTGDRNQTEVDDYTSHNVARLSTPSRYASFVGELNRIAPDARVSAENGFPSHLSERRFIYDYAFEGVQDAEWVLLDYPGGRNGGGGV